MKVVVTAINMDVTVRYPHEFERKRNTVASLTKPVKPKHNLSPRVNNWVSNEWVSRKYKEGDSGKLLLASS